MKKGILDTTVVTQVGILVPRVLVEARDSSRLST